MSNSAYTHAPVLGPEGAAERSHTHISMFPHESISVQWLLKFVQDYHDQLCGLKTHEVSEIILKKQTTEMQVAYVELLRGDVTDDGAPAVARATHFVSHAWGYLFLDLAEAIFGWYKQRDSPVSRYLRLVLFMPGCVHVLRWPENSFH